MATRAEEEAARNRLYSSALKLLLGGAAAGAGYVGLRALLDTLGRQHDYGIGDRAVFSLPAPAEEEGQEKRAYVNMLESSVFSLPLLFSSLGIGAYGGYKLGKKLLDKLQQRLAEEEEKETEEEFSKELNDLRLSKNAGLSDRVEATWEAFKDLGRVTGPGGPSVFEPKNWLSLGMLLTLGSGVGSFMVVRDILKDYTRRKRLQDALTKYRSLKALASPPAVEFNLEPRPVEAKVVDEGPKKDEEEAESTGLPF